MCVLGAAATTAAVVCVSVWEQNKYAKGNHRAEILLNGGGKQRQPCKHHPQPRSCVILNCAIHTERTQRHTHTHTATHRQTTNKRGKQQSEQRAG